MPDQSTTAPPAPVIDVVVTSDGTAQITVDGHAHRLDAGDVETARRRSVAHIASTVAAPTGAPVLAKVVDPDGSWHLLIHPDGSLGEATAPKHAETQAGAVPAQASDDATGPGETSPQEPADVGADPAAQPAVDAARRQRPTAASLLVDAPEPGDTRAREGWRGRLVRTLRLPLAPGAAERQREEYLTAAQAQLGGPRTIMVVNPKGGVGKTTSTLLLAAALGVARGGGVLAWDNNETRGTMALRSQQADHRGNVRTLLAAAPELTSTAGRLGDLDGHVHHQRGVRFDVLPSEQDPTDTGIVDADDFAALHTLLTRFYRLVLVDTGNNIRAANWQAAAHAADQLVITTTVREDSGTSAAWMLDALADSAHAHLLTSAVTLLHDPAPRTSEALRTRLSDHFAAATSDTEGTRTLRMPYEPSLASGGRIDHEALSATGQNAWLRAAGAVITSAGQQHL